MPNKPMPAANHCRDDNLSFNNGHDNNETHKGIVKTKMAVLLAPPSNNAQVKKPVNAAVWKKPRIISFGASFIIIGFFRNKSIPNKITEPKNFLKKQILRDPQNLKLSS